MASSNPQRGPERSRSQAIGSDAVSALHASKPETWELGSIGGDDYGADFQVTVFERGGIEGKYYFLVQLKGTTQAQLRSEDGSFISFSFDRATLNIWHRSKVAVFVAIADMIDSRDPAKCKVYYLLANPILEEILPKLGAEQRTVTLRISTEQLVHRQLDVIPEIDQYLGDLTEALEQYRARKRMVGESAGTPETAINNRVETFTGDLAVSDDIESLISTTSHRAALKGAFDAVKAGAYERALLLAPLPTDAAISADSVAAAISAYLRSRAHYQMGDDQLAREMLDVAVSILPGNDDIAGAYAQKKFDDIALDPMASDRREALLLELNEYRGVAVASVRAKIHAIQGRFAEARAELLAFPVERIQIALAIVSAVERDWPRVIEECSQGKSLPATTQRQMFWYLTLEAKAFFERAIANVDRPPESEPFIIPATGLPGINYGELRGALEKSREAMLAAQRLNWPADTKNLLDVFPVSSMLLGHADDALRLMTGLAFARPTITEIREVVCKFAVQFDRPDIVNQLGVLAGDSTRFLHEDAVMAVAAVRVGNVPKALSAVTDGFLGNQANDEGFCSALLILGIAASSSFRSDILEKIRDRLEMTEESRHFKAMLDSAIKVQKSLLQRPAAILELYEYWNANKRPVSVAHQILANADSTRIAEAEVIVIVAEPLGENLTAENLATVGQALLTLRRAGEATSLLKAAAKRFSEDPTILSLFGAALELSGEPAEALRVFEGLLASGSATEAARRAYIHIASTFGFFDRAEEQVRAAIAKTTRPKARLRLLHTLFQLIQLSGDRPEQVAELAWEYGKLCNKDIEEEEGQFLVNYLVATMQEDVIVPQERVSEFQKRTEDFAARFPDSKILRVGKHAEEDSPENILATIKKMAGASQTYEQQAKLIEQQMDSGKLPIPFSWRPKHFLRGCADVFMLWEMRKRIPLERASAHFPIDIPDYRRPVLPNIDQCAVVISLTSLLLLDEIGELDAVLDYFPRIIVARGVLVSLQETRMPLSGWGRDKAIRILDALKSRFERISHPPFVHENVEDWFLPAWHGEELAAMSEPDRVYFNDDVIETVAVCGSGVENVKASMTTAYFLDFAQAKDSRLTDSRIAECLAAMVKLKLFGFAVPTKCIVASFSDAMGGATRDAEAEKLFTSAESLNLLLGSVWDPGIELVRVVSHFSELTGTLLKEREVSVPAVVALWVHWLRFVEFRSSHSFSGVELLAHAFNFTLIEIDDDAAVVARLWQCLWSTIGVRFAGTLREPEDRIGIRAVAVVLGRNRAEDKQEFAGILFERARLGLEKGTEREELFEAVYIDTLAQEIQLGQSALDSKVDRILKRHE